MGVTSTGHQTGHHLYLVASVLVLGVTYTGCH